MTRTAFASTAGAAPLRGLADSASKPEILAAGAHDRRGLGRADFPSSPRVTWHQAPAGARSGNPTSARGHLVELGA